ncbi:prepilin-type N-terminal cleavage/methylation domain-containing protein [Sphingobium sp. CAP-1]|uniref:prepilin-type N-terminal cleavage/methylation domain-containing protein n=1 Tax=Sphingobium sp. CAP-1 TaxID=2676077 RepID=UPI001E57226D|nr:prepilin-type N-terminal cleavage/methylation domain-containing protein [Sphingobium sp. CAP-1]
MRRSAEHGFTLIELLVSLAILAMFSAMLLSGLMSGRRTWQRVEDRTRAGEDVMATQQLLRALVWRIFPQGSFNGSQPRIIFSGNARDMLFQSAVPDALAPAPPQLYRLALAADGALVLDSQSTLTVTPDRMSARAALTSGLSSLEFAYYGRAEPDMQPRWRNRWDGQPDLPQMIRIRAAFVAGDRRVWPDLIVQPAATVDTLCVYVPATGKCRGRA